MPASLVDVLELFVEAQQGGLSEAFADEAQELHVRRATPTERRRQQRRQIRAVEYALRGRPPRRLHCALCGAADHNARTCPAPLWTHEEAARRRQARQVRLQRLRRARARKLRVAHREQRQVERQALRRALRREARPAHRGRQLPLPFPASTSTASVKE